MRGQAPGGKLPTREFWSGRRVLLTGHTGFKGSWLTCWLQQLGAEVMGVSLPEPPSTPALWDQLALPGVTDVRADVAGRDWTDAATRFDPDVVLHLAAQPLVSVGYEQPAATFDTNVLGTVRVLEALDRLERVEATLVVTTDKVYDPAQPAPHDESHRLGGREPYSASKAAAEIVVAGWPATTAPVATARAGNVIGGGDWARDRLLPDLVRAWSTGAAVTLRRPQSVRPWQHVLEPLRGYLLFAEALADGSEVPTALNFGPAQQQAVSVADLAALAADTWRTLTGDLPNPAWAVSGEPDFAETAELTLDSRLAASALGWVSVLDWQTAVSMTLDWFAAERAGKSPAALVAGQLATYSAIVEGSS
jgi:CDP-glucose 4,6-dehydratase